MACGVERRCPPGARRAPAPARRPPRPRGRRRRDRCRAAGGPPRGGASASVRALAAGIRSARRRAPRASPSSRTIAQRVGGDPSAHAHGRRWQVMACRAPSGVSDESGLQRVRAASVQTACLTAPTAIPSARSRSGRCEQVARGRSRRARPSALAGRPRAAIGGEVTRVARRRAPAGLPRRSGGSVAGALQLAPRQVRHDPAQPARRTPPRRQRREAA